MKKQALVKIQRDGHVVVDTVGFQGVGCKSASQAIELVLGGGVANNSSDTPKPDYFVTTGLPVAQA